MPFNERTLAAEKRTAMPSGTGVYFYKKRARGRGKLFFGAAPSIKVAHKNVADA